MFSRRADPAGDGVLHLAGEVPGDGSAMAMPVGTSRRSPAFRVTASSIQAHRSMHAAPAVAKRGRGMSVPIFGDRGLIFSSIIAPFS